MVISKEKMKLVVLTKKEFLKGAKKTTIFEDTVEDLKYDNEALRKINLKRDRDWGELSCQVFGGEVDKSLYLNKNKKYIV